MERQRRSIEQFKGHCCGCGECMAICPISAITMKQSANGFLYPQVQSDKCIGCSKCIAHCAFNNKPLSNSLLKTYAVKHKNENVRAKSRSGGIFTAISDVVLEKGGVVYGCKLIDNARAVHARATTKKERDCFRGSKYIQSETYHLFNNVKEDLKSGLWVLFSGTPCQVNAIKDFCVDVETEKLLLVDIVCHGVPSPLVWSNYLEYIEKKHKKKVFSIDFRDKNKFDWAAHKETFFFEDSTDVSYDIFTQLFYSHTIIRKDCFQCPYKNLNRVGDISIADCWGIAKHYPEFNDNKGVSLVLINSSKGQYFYEQAQGISQIEVDINKLMQAPLRENWGEPINYDEFWKYYHRHSFEKVVNRYVNGKHSVFSRCVRLPVRILKKCYRVVFHK